MQARWCFVLVLLPRTVHAYRPFDGTDAAVAERGEIELELGTAYLREPAGTRYLVAPAAVFNYGFARDLEAVVDVQAIAGLDEVAGEQRLRLVDNDVMIKWLAHHGALQGGVGPSIAIETGPLLPEIGGEVGLGFEINLIASYARPAFALHVNEAAALTLEHATELFTSVILEGPGRLAVRPVGEATLTYEDGTTTLTGLAGAIWQASGALAIDAGVQLSRSEAEHGYAVRAGVTWAL